MTTTDGTKIVTPVGRIVWGNPCKQRARTDQNNKPIMKADGSPAMQYIFGLAIPKQELLATVWPVMAGEAAKGYPQGAPQNFAWKYDDGDDTRPVNGGGTPYAQREGYPGCYVLTIASALDNPPPVYKHNPQTGGYDQLTADQIKTGDFVAVALTVSCNVPEQRTHTPSLYLNPDAIEFVGYGKEIQSAHAVNPMQAFGGQQRQLPPGASATPVQSSGGVGMPGVGQQQPMPGQMPGMMPQQQMPGMMPQQQMPGMMPQGSQMPGQQLPPPAQGFTQPGMMPQQQMPGMMPQQQMPGMMPQR